MSDDRALLIINPVRSRKTGRELAMVEAVLTDRGLRYDAWFTEYKGHGAELAARGVSEGYGTIVAVGGDGTVNEVVNAAVASPVAVSSVPLGANNDFLRSLGIRTWQEACHVLLDGEDRWLDVGLAEFQGEGGRQEQRYYAVLADVGLGSEVLRNTPRRFRHALGGGLGYIVSLYRTAVQGRARARAMVVRVDGVLRYDEKLLVLEVLNGSYAGGGLKVAPDARLDDGLMNVFVARDLHWLRIWALFPRVYWGTHLAHERIGYFEACSVEVEADAETLVSVDGEVVGRAPARFRVLPGALKVRCPPRRGDTGQTA